jgi:hypothetical protein
MIKPIRRVVTGHNAQGRSVITSDGPSPHVLTLPGRPDFALTDLWVTDRAPASNAGSADPAKRRMSLEPPANGTIFRIVEFPPDAAAGAASIARPPSARWAPATPWIRTPRGIPPCTAPTRWTTRSCSRGRSGP